MTPTPRPRARDALARRSRAMRIATLVLAAGVLAPLPARPGVDTWTTHGPRATWTFEWHDPALPGRAFVGLPGAKALYATTNGGRTFAHVLAIPSFNGSINTIVTPRIVGMTSNPASPNELLAANDWSTIYRSVDGGRTWDSWAPVGNVARVDYAPWGTGEVFVLSAGGLQVSRAGDPTLDAGVPASDFAMLKARPGNVVLVDAAGMAKSTDAGRTWSRVSGVPANPGARVAVSPADGLRIYALVGVQDGSAGSTTGGRVYRSDDGGVAWTALASLPSLPHPSRFLADAKLRDRVYALLETGSGTSLSRSDDGGATFATVNVPGGAPASFGVDGDGAVCLTNDVGYLCSRDGGVHWIAAETDLPGLGLDAFAPQGLWTDLVVAPGQPGYVVSLMLGRSQAFGAQAWERTTGLPTAPVGRDGRMLGTLTSLIGTVGQSVLRSTDDGGVSWSDVRSIPTPGSGCFELAVAPSDPDRMIRHSPGWNRAYNLFLPGCLAASLDGGAAFTDLASEFNQDGRGARTVAFDPGDASVAWLARGLQLFRSADGGLHWSANEALPPTAVRSIAIDPSDGRRVAVQSLTSGVSLTQDGGATWSSLPVPAASIAADVDWSASPARIYAASTDGVWTVPWDGSAWQRMGGTEGWQVNDVKVARPKDTTQRTTLVAATSTGIAYLTLSSGLPFVPVFRFFNTRTGAHFYTANAAERDFVRATYPQFVDEGERFRVLSAPSEGSIPVYRFFNTRTGVHFYTSDEAERDYVIATYPQFAFEGIAFHAFRRDPGTVAVRRYFNTSTGTHFYTSSHDEAVTVQQNYPQFVDEGQRWGVYPSPRDPGAP